MGIKEQHQGDVQVCSWWQQCLEFYNCRAEFWLLMAHNKAPSLQYYCSAVAAVSIAAALHAVLHGELWEALCIGCIALIHFLFLRNVAKHSPQYLAYAYLGAAASRSLFHLAIAHGFINCSMSALQGKAGPLIIGTLDAISLPSQQVRTCSMTVVRPFATWVPHAVSCIRLPCSRLLCSCVL